MILTLRDKIWWFALYSRVFILVLSAVSNFLLPDHTADAFIALEPVDNHKTHGDVIVSHLLSGMMRWDAHYYMHIAKYGYTYENCLAFFPLFPIICRAVTRVLYVVIGGVFNDFSLFAISSVCINLFCFIKSATVLYDLSLQVLGNETLAYKASIFFCLNPASIFFCAPYSESVFTYLTFLGMLKCSCGFKQNISVNCGIIFGLSAITRSNGIVNIGFIAYKCLQNFSQQSFPKFLGEIRKLRGRKLWLPVLQLMSSITIVPYLLSVVLSLIPFISYQVYVYQKYCIPHNHTVPDFLVAYAKVNNFVLPGDPVHENRNHWCQMLLPFSYSYVQSHYWDVGFLRYYQWKQIPNFILAFPIVWIVFSESYFYFQKYYRYCLCLGLDNSLKLKIVPNKSVKIEKEICLAEDIFPYVIHTLFLTMFSVLCAHVQVTTRLISSSCPLFYWFCAKIFSEKNNSKDKKYPSKLLDDLKGNFHNVARRKSKIVNYNVESVENMCSYWRVFIFDCIPEYKAKFVFWYLFLFIFVGTILFSNFLPWT